MPSCQRSRMPGLLFLSTALLTAAMPLTRAQTAPSKPGPITLVRLEDVVVSASRTPQDPHSVSSAVTFIKPVDLEIAQVSDLRAALSAQPGVVIANSGPIGGQTSIFIRGASSNQTLFVVDGIPMNDRAAAYNNFLGAADVSGLSRIEVLRGPQGTLYGSSATGGVILLSTAKGCGEPTGNLSTTFGSFGTRGASGAISGGTRNFGYSATLGRFQTDNELPENSFKAWNYTTRLEGTPTPQTLVGVTLRGQQGDYEDAGGRFYDTLYVQADNHLATAYAQYRVGDIFFSRVTAGQYQRRYTSDDRMGSVTDIHNRRNVVDWQNSWSAVKGLELVGGASIERARQDKSSEITFTDSKAAYLTGTYRPVQTVTLNTGLRYDDFDTFGSATTWRSGIAWLAATGTKLRATVGTGFCAPSNDDINGVPAWGWLSNPNLKAEKSTGWDVGIDQDLWDKNATVSLTYFHTRYRGRLDYVSDPLTWTGRTENLTRSTSQGIELAATVRTGERVESRVGYTYLDARDDTRHVRLIRQPRHIVDAETRVRAAAGLLVGAGLHIAAGREEDFYDMTQWRTVRIDAEDYTTVRVFASYELTANLLLKGRVENALDEKYEEVYGYPALTRAVYGSLEWKF